MGEAKDKIKIQHRHDQQSHRHKVYLEFEDTHRAQPAKVFLLPDMVIVCVSVWANNRGRPVQQVLCSRGSESRGPGWVLNS